jgi:hypothetical protein
MADDEKALRQPSGFMDDRLSLKSSRDSKAIETGLGQNNTNHTSANKAISTQLDVEKGPNPATLDNCGDAAAADPNLVEWDENDPENPMNFGLSRKVWMSTMGSLVHQWAKELRRACVRHVDLTPSLPPILSVMSKLSADPS